MRTCDHQRTLLRAVESPTKPNEEPFYHYLNQKSETENSTPCASMVPVCQMVAASVKDTPHVARWGRIGIS